MAASFSGPFSLGLKGSGRATGGGGWACSHSIFNTSSYDWTNNPPLPDAAASVAVLLNRNLVAQTKDSTQILSTDALRSGEARSETHVSHVYPLGENYTICVLRPTSHLVVLGLGALRGLSRGDENLPFMSLFADEIEPVRALPHLVSATTLAS
jgi:hypothetical protein